MNSDNSPHLLWSSFAFSSRYKLHVILDRESIKHDIKHDEVYHVGHLIIKFTIGFLCDIVL